MSQKPKDEAPTVIQAHKLSASYPGGVRVGDCIRSRFVLEEEIGRGGMGIVFKALDLRKQETEDKEPYVALKVISNNLKRVPESLIALQREAKKAQKLAHPNVATVYDFDRDGDEAFVTMELLEGKSLSDLLKDEYANGLNFDKALPIIQGMARGLAYAHQKGIVHSDFKPGNVFISNSGAVKILDFGIARAMSQKKESEENEHTVFDPSEWDAITPAYASFEMFYHAPADPRDDIYALACVSYQLLSGQHPFKKLPANKAKAQGLKPKPIAGLNKKINKLLIQGLSFERNDRLESVASFLDQLVPRKNQKARVFIAAVAICLVAFAGYYTWYKTSEINLVETAIEQGDPWRSIPQAVDENTQERINRLLQVAQAHLSIGRLIKPATSNAAEAYMEVLKLQPGNEAALEGVNKIVSSLDASIQKLETTDVNQALNLTQRALQILPGEPRLKKIEAALQKSQ